MERVGVDRLRARVRATRGPQFILPARFATATFENYLPDPAFPEQSAAFERVRQHVALDPASRWSWRRVADAAPRGLYLDGPPGIGKTHLLAGAFHAAAEPKLFATFDEFSAAAGTLGMQRLTRLLAGQRIVCVDEIDLRDPGNIMLFTSLVRAMLALRTRILATANAEPAATADPWFSGEDFAREFREIAGAFAIIRLGGADRRSVPAALETRSIAPRPRERVWETRWESLLPFLRETHPMYDAAWLQELDVVVVDRFERLDDPDGALRFVRFVDRVYDRSVALSVERPIPTEELLAGIWVDHRFRLHVARCASRLAELVHGGAAAEPTAPRD